jgi:uncharacterized LabA/DUF88 family protein
MTIQAGPLGKGMNTYLFIDGEYLRQAYQQTMDAFYGTVPDINYRDLPTTFGGPRRIYYYDAIAREPVGSETPKDQEQRIKGLDVFHVYLNSLPNWHVREGFVSRGRRASRRSQKAVDVQLAVDALEHAIAGNMGTALFVAGDLDFEPLFFSLNRFGVRVTVYYERKTATETLLEAADERIQMTLAHFHALAVPSFQETHPRAAFMAGEGLRAEPLINTGRWKGRRVEMRRAGVGHEGRILFVQVEPGPNPIQEPSLQSYYTGHEEAQASLAFELNYGDKITWDSPFV